MLRAQILFVATALASCATAPAGSDLADLPHPVSNNAVAGGLTPSGDLEIFSFMGIGPELDWSAITTESWLFEDGEWKLIPPVPGGEGRIAGTAARVGDRVFLFGGYTVASDGSERSIGRVDIFDVENRSWSTGAPIPVPVDDSVSGVYRDRWIYLVSGWSDRDNVSNVQVYDTADDTWMQATPIPGTPVFGHAGALLGGEIVYVDGAFRSGLSEGPKYVGSDEAWRGSIDGDDPATIVWTRIPVHPGSARYRTAACADPYRNLIVFSGGTDNPYNIDGVGYDGTPSEPVPVTFAWDLEAGSWLLVNEEIPLPSMDHRGMITVPEGWIRVGGMASGRRVTAEVVLEKAPSGQ